MEEEVLGVTLSGFAFSSISFFDLVIVMKRHVGNFVLVLFVEESDIDIFLN